MEKIVVSKEDVGLRLDNYLKDKLGMKRQAIQTLIDKGKIFLNGNSSKNGYKLKEGDEISLNFDPLKEEKKEYDLKKENIPLDIVYEDEDLILINKPKGLVVHPGAGNKEHTLANALAYYSSSLSKINGTFRPGIVHRIDKDTSGLLLVCKNDEAHHYIAKQLETHTMHRSYLALVKGNFTNNFGEIDAPIGRDEKNRLRMKVKKSGKEAITRYEVKERYRGYTLLSLDLKTGRTHQIRAHMAFIDHPIVGDNLYGGKSSLYDNGQLLHAYKIVFKRPKDEKEMTFEIPLPQYFLEVLNKLA